MLNETHPTLEEIQERFEQWRRDKKGREKIPETLWAAAAALASRHPVFKIAEALRLNYNDLKERASKGSIGTPGSPAFVEFKPVPAATVSECVIEIEKPGAKMKISFKGGVDVFELSKSFWGAGA
ncbi:MAG: hypothetical protein M0Z61_08630 [Nitrospiraceae bacterium]|nr:hypothetical protein [Nitrospiraceae bacterium]